VGTAAVDDMDLGAACLKGVEAGPGLGKHPPPMVPLMDKVLDLLFVERRNEGSCPCPGCRLVREQDQLLALTRLPRACHEVRIDVVGLSVSSCAHRAHDRYESAFVERIESAGRTSVTSPTSPTSMISVSPVSSDLLVILSFFAWMSPPSLPVRPTALRGLVDQVHDLLVHLAAQHHLDNIHGLCIGDRWPDTTVGFLPIRSIVAPIWGPPPWTMTGLIPMNRSSTTFLGEAVLQRIVDHGVPAILDNEGLARKVCM